MCLSGRGGLMLPLYSMAQGLHTYKSWTFPNTTGVSQALDLLLGTLVGSLNDHMPEDTRGSRYCYFSATSFNPFPISLHIHHLSTFLKSASCSGSGIFSHGCFCFLSECHLVREDSSLPYCSCKQPDPPLLSRKKQWSVSFQISASRQQALLSGLALLCFTWIGSPYVCMVKEPTCRARRIPEWQNDA